MQALYKYRSWNRDDEFKYLTDLIGGSLWFSTASAVNDPFEFRCAVDFNCDHERTIRTFIKVELALSPSMPWSEAERKVREVFARLPETKIRERQWELSFNLWRKLSSCVSMSCFSATPVELLLWAHYASGHRGVAIEIEPVGLENYLYEVTYDDNIPTLDPFCLVDMRAAMDADLFRTLFLRKAKCWEYEREFRIMKMRADGHTEKLQPGAVKRVIIGCGMPDERQQQLIKWMKENRPDVGIAYAVPRGSSRYDLRID